MSGTVQDVFDRLDILLQDLDPSVSRRLSTPLVKSTDETPPTRGWPPHTVRGTTIYYLPEWAGEDGAAKDFINKTPSLREFTLEFQLMLHCGEGLAVVEAEKKRLQSFRLMAAWEEVKSVIEWPGNWDAANTGWVKAWRIQCARIRQDKDTLRLPCSFLASYDKEY